MKYQVMITRYFLVDVEARTKEEALDLVADDTDKYIEARPETNRRHEYEDTVEPFATPDTIIRRDGRW